MIERNDRSAAIYRRSGANLVRERATGDHYSQGRRVYPLSKHGKEAALTSQHRDGGGGRKEIVNQSRAHLSHVERVSCSKGTTCGHLWRARANYVISDAS